jgi:AraC-like DNA-binding protein
MLDRLLDSVDVTVEPVVASRATRPAQETPATGVLPLAGGARVCFTVQSVVIQPPSPRPPLRDHTGEEPVVEGGVRIHVTYRGVGLFDHLTEPILAPLPATSPLRECLRELVEEIGTFRPGRCVMVATLVRRLLVLVLRRSWTRSGLFTWMAALEDSRLGRAVDAMEESPEHAFTLPELAEVAGMSRSAFAAHFAETMKHPPIEYLKTLRLTRAATLLRHTDLPIKGVAARVGYSSRSSFTRAFIAHHGVAPHEFRALAGPSAVRSESTPWQERSAS